MSVPRTVNAFLELLSRSGLVDSQSLSDYIRNRHAASDLPKVPSELAEVLVRDGVLTRFQAGQLLQGRWRNFVLSGKYKILECLGSGGMGSVFLCEHLLMCRRVALKVLPASRANDPAAVERFHREARAVAHLDHPNIVGAYDIDHDGKLHFLVMEYIDGSTLERIVEKTGPMTLCRAAHYVRQAALGLQHAHESGLVHRDIKPSNMLVDRNGTVKILDMGIARFFRDQSDDLTNRNVQNPLGTADYMAPEQAIDSHSVDIRADIYGLGATFYFLLTGKSPFKDGTPMEKMIWHQIRLPRPIREIRPEVPEELSAVLDRMLAKTPEQRFQTPAEVADAVAAWTKTPILPPTLEEMPDLCLAAQSTRATAVNHGPPTPRLPTAVPPARLPKPRSSHPVTQSLLRSSSSCTPAEAEPATLSAIEADLQPARKSSLQALPQAKDRRRNRRIVIAAMAAVSMVVAGTLGFAIDRAAKNSRRSALGQPEVPPVANPVAPPPLALLVPAYFYPDGEGLKQWDRLIASAGRTHIVAIANVESGPGKLADLNYVKIIDRARRADIRVIGYVSTKYAKRALQEVKADVLQWVRFYPAIDGVFFDEQASDAGHIEYYASLYQQVRSELGRNLVVTNPGTVCAEAYVARPAADLVCLAEGGKDFSKSPFPAWVSRYPASRFAAQIIKTEDPEQMRQYVREMATKNVGYGYITDGSQPNPWGRLPPYWEIEVEAMHQPNARKAPDRD